MWSKQASGFLSPSISLTCPRGRYFLLPADAAYSQVLSRRSYHQYHLQRAPVAALQAGFILFSRSASTLTLSQTRAG